MTKLVLSVSNMTNGFFPLKNFDFLKQNEYFLASNGYCKVATAEYAYLCYYLRESATTGSTPGSGHFPLKVVSIRLLRPPIINRPTASKCDEVPTKN